MRLIDADEFRRFAHEQLENDKFYSADDILEFIDEQSIAYDFEAVVQQLEMEANIAASDKERYYYVPSQYEFARGYFQAICAALGIVKEGGAECIK